MTDKPDIYETISKAWQLAGKMGAIEVRGIFLKEACDEIERLRGENAGLRQCLDFGEDPKDGPSTELAMLRARVEKLERVNTELRARNDDLEMVRAHANALRGDMIDNQPTEYNSWLGLIDALDDCEKIR